MANSLILVSFFRRLAPASSRSSTVWWRREGGGKAVPMPLQKSVNMRWQAVRRRWQAMRRRPQGQRGSGREWGRGKDTCMVCSPLHLNQLVVWASTIATRSRSGILYTFCSVQNLSPIPIAWAHVNGLPSGSIVGASESFRLVGHRTAQHATPQHKAMAQNTDMRPFSLLNWFKSGGLLWCSFRLMAHHSTTQHSTPQHGAARQWKGSGRAVVTQGQWQHRQRQHMQAPLTWCRR